MKLIKIILDFFKKVAKEELRLSTKGEKKWMIKKENY